MKLAALSCIGFLIAITSVAAYGYGEYTTHARITAKAIDLISEDEHFSDLTLKNSTLLYQIHRNGTESTHIDLNSWPALTSLPVAGSVCEDERSPREGCPRTYTFRNNMHFIEDRKDLALPYEVWVYQKTRANFMGTSDIDENWILMDLLGTFGKQLAGKNTYDFYNVTELKNNNFLHDAELSFHGTVERFYYDPDAGLETVEYNVDEYKPGHRFINSYDWGLDGGGTSDNLHNSLNWVGAIESYNHGTWGGRADAFAKLGHVAHLIQDATVPEHVALQAHPGGGFETQSLLQKLLENRDEIIDSFGRMADENADGKSAACIENTCFIKCAGIRNEDEVGEDFYNQMVSQVSTFPNSRGYEKFVSDEWDVNRFRNFETQPFFNPDYVLEDYYDEAIRTSKSFIKNEMHSGIFVEYDNRRDQVGGLQPSIRIDDIRLNTIASGILGCPDADLTLELFLRGIPSINHENEELYRDISDLQVEKAIQLTAGMFKTFYSIVNPPPYVSEFRLWQSPDLVNYTVSYPEVYSDGTTSPKECQKNTGAYVKHCVVESRKKIVELSNPDLVKKDYPTKISISVANGPVEQREKYLCLPQSDIEGDVTCEITGYDPLVKIVAKSKEPLDREYFLEAQTKYELSNHRTEIPLGTPPAKSYYYHITIPVEGNWMVRPFLCPGLDCSQWFGTFDMPKFLKKADFEITVDLVEKNPMFSSGSPSRYGYETKNLDIDPTTVTKTEPYPPFNWEGYEPGKHFFQVSLDME